MLCNLYPLYISVDEHAQRGDEKHLNSKRAENEGEIAEWISDFEYFLPHFRFLC